MFESLIITFREGVEIALIVGILLVYLRKTERDHLRLPVFVGLGTALVSSLATALLLEYLAMDFELFEGYLFFVAALFVTTMIIWMWRTSKHIKKEIERKVDEVSAAAGNSTAAALGIFFFVFLMVVREGIETVIFLRAVGVSEGWGSLFVGAFAGVLGATIFGVLFVKGSLRIDIGRFLKVTAIVLLIFVAQLLVNGIHEFYELGVFPPDPDAMAIVGPIVRNNLLFILAVFSIPAIMFVIPPSKRAEAPSGNRNWQIAAGLVSCAVIFFLGFDTLFSSSRKPVITPPEFLEPTEGVISIPVSRLLDGNLHRFAWKDEEGTEIRFFALRTGASTFSTAFDACRACYNYGFYYMLDDELICSVCEAPSELSKLAVVTEGDENQSGSMEGLGCAPLYLPSRLSEGNVIVRVNDLRKNKKYFTTSFDYSSGIPVPTGVKRDLH
ncbi:MAG TPA: Fe-S-containing protein [Bacteroidota bacterium]|nr:Fe-S-containing protein [Bacteroidota bacterium]